jgi:hypothetical protein
MLVKKMEELLPLSAEIVLPCLAYSRGDWRRKFVPATHPLRGQRNCIYRGARQERTASSMMRPFSIRLLIFFLPLTVSLLNNGVITLIVLKSVICI